MNHVETANGGRTADRLIALQTLLEEITLSINANQAFAPSSRQQWAERWLIRGFIAALLILISLMAWYRFDRLSCPQAMPWLLTSTYRVWGATALLYGMTVIIGIIMMMRQHCHKHFAQMLENRSTAGNSDAAFLSRLLAFDNVTLECGLLQYQHRWGIFDGRFSVLLADMRKLSLFPAIAGSAIALTLLLNPQSHLLLWGTLLLMCSLYLVAFYAMGHRERPEQVISLLEYALQQRAQSCIAGAPHRVMTCHFGQSSVLHETKSAKIRPDAMS